jgi:Major Facilitator Superfamily
MVVLDAKVVNIALPSAQRALHFSNADREWVVTAYALAFGSLLLLSGRMGDLFGRKPAFLTGARRPRRAERKMRRSSGGARHGGASAVPL